MLKLREKTIQRAISLKGQTFNYKINYKPPEYHYKINGMFKVKSHGSSILNEN